MSITNAIMQMRRGNETDFDPDKMKPGEWAVSLDSKYVRMCFSPGVCVRMATYEAFEEDMVKIESILKECQTIEETISKIQNSINGKELVIEQYVKDAKSYSETASIEADRAQTEADRAKQEADRAQEIAGGDFVTNTEIKEYSLIKDTGYELGLSIDESTYVMTIQLKNASGSVLSEKTIDFPIESMVVNATYSNGVVTLLLQNGTTLPVEVSALVSGLVEDTFTIAGIDLKDNITEEELKQALQISYEDLIEKPLIQDTYEEIMANTVSGRIAGANGVKEGFTSLNDSLEAIGIYRSTIAPSDITLNATSLTDVYTIENIHAGTYLVNVSLGYLGGVSDACITKVMAYTNEASGGIFGVSTKGTAVVNTTRILKFNSDNEVLTIKVQGVGTVTTDHRFNRLELVFLRSL